MDGDDRMLPDIKPGKAPPRMIHTPPPAVNPSSNSNNNNNNIPSSTQSKGQGPASEHFSTASSFSNFSMEAVMKRLQVLENRVELNDVSSTSHVDAITARVMRNLDQRLGMMDKTLELLVRDVTDIKSSYANEINELKSVVSAEISARRKFQMSTRATLEALNKQLQNDTFAIRKEFLHLSETLGSRVRILESSHADQTLSSKNASEDMRDYVTASVQKFRQQIEGYNNFSGDISELKRSISRLEGSGVGSSSLDAVSNRLDTLEGDLRKVKVGKSHVDQLQRQLTTLADQVDHNIGTLHKKFENLDAKVKVTMSQAMKDISDELENYSLLEELQGVQAQIDALKTALNIEIEVPQPIVHASKQSQVNSSEQQKTSARKSVDEDYAAAKIQATYRGQKVRSNMAPKQSKDAAAVRDTENSLDDERNKAAMKIQKNMKKSLRNGPKSKNYESDVSNVQIESRDMEENLDNIPVESSNDEAEAATKIQSIYRGGKVRGNYKKESVKETMKAPVEANVSNSDKKSVSDDQAATKIQSIYRGGKVRGSYKKEEVQEPVEAPVENSIETSEKDSMADDQAATKIQSIYRGSKARSSTKNTSVAENKSTPVAINESTSAEIIGNEKGEENDDGMRQNAATKLQSVYRGGKTRTDLKNSKSSSTNVPSVVTTNAQNIVSSAIEMGIIQSTPRLIERSNSSKITNPDEE